MRHLLLLSENRSHQIDTPSVSCFCTYKFVCNCPHPLFTTSCFNRRGTFHSFKAVFNQYSLDTITFLFSRSKWRKSDFIQICIWKKEYLFFKIYFFIWERESEGSSSGGRGKQRKRIPSRLPAEHRASHRFDLTTLRSGSELDTYTTDLPRHPWLLLLEWAVALPGTGCSPNISGKLRTAKKGSNSLPCN